MTAVFLVKSVKTKKSLGQALKEERESLGWTVRKAANVSLVQEKYINAIESEKFNLLPEDLMGLNLIKKYIKTLGGSKELLALAETTFSSKSKDKEAFKPLVKQHTFLTADHFKILGLGAIFLAIVIYLGFEVFNLIKPPNLIVLEPGENIETSSPTIIVKGSTEDTATVVINEKTISKEPNGSFETIVDLARGLNTVTIKANKKYSQPKIIYRTIIFDDSETIQTSQTLNNPNSNL